MLNLQMPVSPVINKVTPPDLDEGGASLALFIRPWFIIGFTVIFFSFGVLGAWAALAPIAKAVIANGLVKVDSNRKKLQHLEGGTVNTILVKDGDSVKKGDVLIRLDQVRAKASYAIVQTSYQSEMARVARLMAERDQHKEISFSEDLLNHKEDQEVFKLIDGQQRIFNARKNTLQGSIDILQQQILQLKEKLSGLRAQKRAKQRQLVLVREELEAVNKLFDKHYIDKPRILKLKREIAELNGDLGDFISELAETGEAISEKRQEILQRKNDFDQAVVDEIREAQTKILDLRERLEASSHVLNNIEIRSPSDGTVVSLAVFSKGEVIAPGATILEIVPINDSLLIEAKVKTTEIDNLLLGQKADVRLTAFDSKSTPILIGELNYISADAFEDERTGQSYFYVKVTVSDKELQKLKKQLLHPGMPAEVIIKIGERTVLEYITQPLTDALARAWREQ